jgi:hypothetical protein
MTLRSVLGYGHGMAWKLSAQASKVGFVLLVLPKLPDGVFAQYAYISSLALLAALALSFGGMDSLPTFVRGRATAQRNLAPLVQIPLLMTCSAFVVFLLGGGLLALTTATAGCSISYFLLSGAVRTTSPSMFEIVSNAPSILFLGLALGLPTTSIEQLLVLFFVANMGVMVAVAWRAGLSSWPTRRACLTSRSTARKLFSKGNYKSASNVLMVADFRALVTAPNFILGVQPTDALAVALTIGEAFWQLGMVVVNRNYARYCMGAGTIGRALITGAQLMGFLITVGAFFILVPLPIAIPRLDWTMIGWAIILFAAVTALSEVRAFFWSRDLHDHAILLVQTMILLFQVVVIGLVPQQFWLQTVAIVLATSTTMGLLALSTSHAKVIRSA